MDLTSDLKNVKKIGFLCFYSHFSFTGISPICLPDKSVNSAEVDCHKPTKDVPYPGKSFVVRGRRVHRYLNSNSSKHFWTGLRLIDGWF